MNLKSPDSKVIAIQQCKLLKKELQESKQAPSKKSWSSDSSDYRRVEKISNLVETVFRIHTELCEYDSAIKYFNGNNIEREAEVSLYVLFRLLLEYKLKELWLREYDEALKKE